jgi:hypothetical protein
VSDETAADLKVFIRMYRALLPGADYKGLLGDCFLIRIVDGASQSTILIDCGILQGSPDAKNRMDAIARDIVRTTNGRLDLLVVTHPHWDHISGFSLAADTFFDPDKLKVDNIWMGWTESPDDSTALALQTRMDRTAAAFVALAERMDPNGADPRFALNADLATDGLDAFLGPLSAAATDEGLAAAARMKGREVLDALKKLRKPNYLSPGTVLPTPGTTPLRAYVLGPPRNTDRLYDDLPSKGDARETYFDRMILDEDLLLRVAEGGEPDPSQDSPFARTFTHLKASDVQNAAAAGDIQDWLRQRYYDAKAATGADQTRRRIDADWLGAAGPLAIALDGHINNSSLVLAFELPDASLLLFAADAQVGNWLSWHDQPYVADGVSHTAADLLARTRFYKVGHHGSENATLADKGLALMTREDLVAAIPTDEELGSRQGRKGWRMPDPKVNHALLERTHGRILRNDRAYDTASRKADPLLAGVEAGFFDRITEDPMFLEYRIFGHP